MQGAVKWFDPVKRFGFIAPSEGGKDIFVHLDDILNPSKNLDEGVRVEFEVTQTDKGPQATHVRIAD